MCSRIWQTASSLLLAMKTVLDHFLENISRARSLSALGRFFDEQTTQALDLSDIYRASLVLSVSALDHFVHEFVRVGMLEVHNGARPPTGAHLSFKIPLAAARVGIADTSKNDWLDEAVRDAHSWLSFQHPDKIADAIRLVSGVKLWEEVGTELGSAPKVVKAQLIAIVDRRNKIAHEADMDPTNPGERWPISDVLVNDAFDYIESVVRAIDKVAV